MTRPHNHMGLDGLKLLACIMMCQAVGMAGSLFTRASLSGWYVNLEKPFFNPPGSVFAPVWATLYLLMGVSLFLIWRKGLYRAGVKAAMGIFLIQLGLNGLWSIVFFGGRSIIGGLVVIVLLWVSILRTMQSFFHISKNACYLLIPYILWVSFALVLNAALLILN